MSGIAIWGIKKREIESSGPNISIEAHFNLWRLKNDRSRKNEQLLDIGFMVENPQRFQTLKIYFPFLAQEKIEDLGAKLTTTSAVQAIFNEPWYAVSTPEANTINVMDYNKNDIFSVYRFNSNELDDVEKCYGGSVLNLQMPAELQKKTYFRFRIHIPTTGKIATEYKPSNSWLESAFSVTETIDFHVNEKRNLPEDLLRAMHRGSEVDFTKIHLFLMRYNIYDYVFSYPLPSDIRTLEQGPWVKYIGEDYYCEQIRAYHWRQKGIEKETFPNFNIFAKFRFQYANWKTILIFLGAFLVIGALGSLAASFIFSCIK